MTVAPLALVREGARTLADCGCDSPELDAEVLVAHAMGIDRAGLHSAAPDPLHADVEAEARRLIDRRSAREPVSQLVGYRWFRNLKIAVTPAVLTPRPETELLVEWALDLPRGSRVADIGTGSGAVALALADERPDLEVTGTDIEGEALAVARSNASSLGLSVRFAEGDLLDAVDGEVDAVVSNPPYISEEELSALPPEVAEFEPRRALCPGPTGLELIERLVQQAAARKIARIAIEVGYTQAERVAVMLATSGWSHVEVRDDLASVPRVVIGTSENRSVDEGPAE